MPWRSTPRLMFSLTLPPFAPPLIVPWKPWLTHRYRCRKMLSYKITNLWKVLGYFSVFIVLSYEGKRLWLLAIWYFIYMLWSPFNLKTGLVLYILEDWIKYISYWINFHVHVNFFQDTFHCHHRRRNPRKPDQTDHQRGWQERRICHWACYSKYYLYLLSAKSLLYYHL